VQKAALAVLPGASAWQDFNKTASAGVKTSRGLYIAAAFCIMALILDAR